jgi:hypothetical protein
LLLEFNADHSATKSRYGYGTADSVPQGGKITVKGQPVQFQSFAPSGEAQVTPIDITSKLPSDKDAIDFRATSLDCGVSGQTSDVYLVFH